MFAQTFQQAIGCLAITLACMPTKNFNKHWDEQDPNAEIPRYETKAIDDMTIDTVPTQTHSAQNGTTSADGIEKVERVQEHVEKAP